MAHTRHPTVYVAGSLFLDIIMSGLRHPPRPGEEQWVSGGGVMPGGVANQAIACSRLGMDATIIAYLGQDRVGRWTAEMLTEEGISLTAIQPMAQGNVTVSQVMDGDRAFTTYGCQDVPLPDESLPAPDVFLCCLGYLREASDTVAKWKEHGTIVIADTGWDDTGQWPVSDLEALKLADVFVPNCSEAQHYTRTLTTEDAGLALLDWIDTVVITCGGRGVYVAQRDTTDTFTEFPALKVEAVDTTGAGDAFSSGLALGLALGHDLTTSVHLGQIAAGWTVTHIGGSVAAPHLSQLQSWVGQFGAPFHQSFTDVITTHRPQGTKGNHDEA